VQQSPINATQNQRGPRGAGRTGGGRFGRPVGRSARQHGVHGHAGQKRPRPGRWKRWRRHGRRDFRRGRLGQTGHGVPASDVRRQGRGVRRRSGGGLQAGQHGVHGNAGQEGLLRQQQGFRFRVLRYARQEGTVRGRVLRRPRQEVAGPRGRRRRGRPIVTGIYPVQDYRRTEVGTL